MKQIWILNHYATNMFFEHGGRHYCFAKYLIRAGYDVRIFCASTIHNTGKNLIQDGRLYEEDTCDGIPFVFVKARNYHGNGKSRVLNMIDYYRNIFKVTGQFEQPDIIIGSSVHPLACVAAIKLGKRYACKAIVEIRDLWPESIVAYNIAKKNNPVIRFLYGLEQWIYKKADAIIFTMEGGRDYILEKGWDKAHGGSVDLNKVHYINNGTDLEHFTSLASKQLCQDWMLEEPDYFKVIYTGSIRLTNQVELLVQVAEMAQKEIKGKLRFLIYGEGEQREPLAQICEEKQLKNIHFMGSREKEAIPYILSKANVTVLDMYSSELFRFGVSPNKLFEYLAAGKPIVSGLICSYDIIKTYQCGVVVKELNKTELYRAIMKVYEAEPEEYSSMAEHAVDTAKQFDFKVLTQKLISIIEGEV